jgi:hypothetical protein
MHKLKWLISILGIIALLPGTTEIARSQTQARATGYIVVTLDSIKTERTAPESLAHLNLTLAAVAGTGSRLQRIAWPTELWQSLILGEELLSDAREEIPLFALPIDQMSDELALTLVILDNTKAAANWLKISAPSVLEEVSLLTATWLTGSTLSREQQSQLVRDRLQPQLGSSVSLVGLHALKYKKAEGWGVSEKTYQAEMPIIRGDLILGRIRLSYSIQHVGAVCQPVDAEVKLSQVTVHKNGDASKASEIYLWTRVASGFAASEDLASTNLRLPNEKVFAIEEGQTKRLDQTLFEGRVDSFLYLELKAWDEDPTGDPDDLLGSYSGLWLPRDLETRPVPVEPRVVPLTARRKTAAGEVTFEFELILRSSPCLLLQPPIEAGEKTHALAPGDFNNDGNPDLAVAQDLKDRKISIWLGDGRGGFRAGSVIGNVGDGPNALVVTDLNLDKKLDLVVASDAGGTLAILLGRGDGTFDAPSQIPVGVGIMALASADLNNDRRPDLLVAVRSKNSVLTLLGNGTGRFSAPIERSVRLEPTALGVGDFNADGKLDLVVTTLDAPARENPTIQVLLGQGNGLFWWQAPVNLPGRPSALATGDFNGDGRLDVGVTLSDLGLVALYAGDGKGQLGASAFVYTGQAPSDLQVLDLNEDRSPDLAVVNSGDGAVSILLGDGLGRFGVATNYPVVDATQSGLFSRLVQADWDNDGTLDLALVQAQTGAVTILLNRLPR